MAYRCSECGGEVIVLSCKRARVIALSLTVDPPITRFQCRKCGRHRDEPPEPPEPVTIDMSSPPEPAP